MPFATAADGTQLYYETLGAGEPLLLVSGQASDHHNWDTIRDDFAAKYHVIVYDHRGTGQSDKPETPAYSTRGFAQDAIAVLEYLGIARAHAYGISMGGRICQWLGIDYAARIGALVLAATTPGNAHGVRRPPDIDMVMSSGDNVRLVDALVSSSWSAAHPEYLEFLAETSRHHLPPYTQKLHYLASEGHDSWDWLPSITSPTLVIHGSEDRINMTENAALLANRIPGADLYIVQGGRHAFNVEFRSEASQVVLEFLARHPLRS